MFPLELQDTGLIAFDSQFTHEEADVAAEGSSASHDPTFYRYICKPVTPHIHVVPLEVATDIHVVPFEIATDMHTTFMPQNCTLSAMHQP